MDTYDAIVSKRDIRHYTGAPISDELLNKVLQAGRMSGTAKNHEANRFIVVRDQAVQDALVESGDFSTWIGSSDVIIGIATPDTFERQFDVGRQAQNMMLAAQAEGLGSCPVTMHHKDKSAAAVGLPEGWSMEMVITFGWPSPDRPDSPLKRKRVALDELVHENSWED